MDLEDSNHLLKNPKWNFTIKTNIWISFFLLHANNEARFETVHLGNDWKMNELKGSDRINGWGRRPRFRCWRERGGGKKARKKWFTQELKIRLEVHSNDVDEEDRKFDYISDSSEHERTNSNFEGMAEENGLKKDEYSDVM